MFIARWKDNFMLIHIYIGSIRRKYILFHLYIVMCTYTFQVFTLRGHSPFEIAKNVFVFLVILMQNLLQISNLRGKRSRNVYFFHSTPIPFREGEG